MPQFEVETFIPQLFWLGILFSGFYLINSRVFIPRLLGIFARRSETIEEILKKAETLATEAEQLNLELLQKQATLKEQHEKEIDALRHELFQKYQEQEHRVFTALTASLKDEEAAIKRHESKLLGTLIAEKKALLKKAEEKIFVKWKQNA